MAPKKSQRRLISEELIERANSGRHRDVADLLEQGADTEVQDWSGYTAVSEAAVAGHTVVVGQLLRAAADPNAEAQDGRTALHRAAFHCWLPCVKLLVENGADPFQKDNDGRIPYDLARSGAVREYLEGVTADQVAEYMLAHREKMALRPPGVAEEEAAQIEEPQPEAVFSPPPRKAEEDAEQAAAKAAAKAEREAKAAEEAEAKREERYRRAVAELRAELGEDRLDDISDSPPAHFENTSKLVVPRVAIVGAGEPRLEGTYRATFVTKDRVDFEKVGDKQCQVFWSQWHDEWRMLIGDFKLGSTLYRHRHRPNVKFDECHGVPKEGWVKWFGADPVPTIRYLAEDEEDYVPEPPKEEEKPEGAVRLVIEEDTASAQPRKTGEQYLEVKSSLNIVSQPDDPAAMRAQAAIAAATGTTAHLAGHRPVDVRLREGDSKIVETSEGLFSSEEVVQERPVAAAPTPEEKAAMWLEATGEAPEVPANLDAILAAKSAAQDLFNEGKVKDARQATTAALRSLTRLLASGDAPASQEELESLLGVLHSNRSLLLTNQIQGGDKEVLAYGSDAVWRLVVKDTDAALRENSGNFKASFRRAKALFELGELDAAMADATIVCDHYARKSDVSNPEAAALRKKIMDAIKKERGKWGEKGGPRWNSSTHEKNSLITELGIEIQAEPSAPRVITSAPWTGGSSKSSNLTAGGAIASAAAGRSIPAPRTGADVEKALLSTAKADPSSQLAYFKQHVTADAIKKFYRKTPLGPDLLGAMVRVLADLASEDVSAARERLAALASAPSSRMQSAMFDSEERQIFSQLLSKVGSDAAAAWEDPAAPGGEGGA